MEENYITDDKFVASEVSDTIQTIVNNKPKLESNGIDLATLTEVNNTSAEKFVASEASYYILKVTNSVPKLEANSPNLLTLTEINNTRDGNFVTSELSEASDIILKTANSVLNPLQTSEYKSESNVTETFEISLDDETSTNYKSESNVTPTSTKTMIDDDFLTKSASLSLSLDG